jgi:hypothetical protein
MKLHRCNHGPFRWIQAGLTPITLQCPSQEILFKNFKCPFCDIQFPSLCQLELHINNKLFGNQEIPTF